MNFIVMLFNHDDKAYLLKEQQMCKFENKKGTVIEDELKSM